MTQPRPAYRPQRLHLPLILIALVVAAIGLIGPRPAAAQNDGEKPAGEKPGGEKPATPIMPVKDVRVGMKGYGLSVFHGIKVEPFEVEVISVMGDFEPKRSVIWCRGTDERMQKVGAVSGMSGSPIYLWAEGEEQVVGKGGKLIGALAYGYPWSKDCFIGVQPIEQMRETAGRIDVEKAKQAFKTSKSTQPGATLIDILRAAESQKYDERDLWQAKLLAEVVGVSKRDIEAATNSAGATPLNSWPRELPGKPQRLMLPLSVADAQLAEALRPVLEPAGITPTAAPAGAANTPPPGIDPDKIKFEPGGVLGVPLAFGDGHVSSVIGTITEVFPDGSLIGFGHPMFGEGDLNLPMATGYVHFVLPSVNFSRKMGGSLLIKGALLRDDNSAVAGVPNFEVDTAPITVKVNFEGREKHYKYNVIHHRRLTPTLAVSAALTSLTAERSLSEESTIRMKARAVFEGDREVDLAGIVTPGTQQTQLVLSMLPPISAMVQNQHEPLRLKSFDVELDVTPKIELLQMVGVRVEKDTLAPGEEVKVTVVMRRNDGQRELRHVTLKLPESLEEGKYSVTVGDASSYAQQLSRNRPHLMLTDNADDVHEMVKLITSIRKDALYTVLQLPESGIAIGRRELPQLPSSRRALIASSQNTLATTFADFIDQRDVIGELVDGSVTFQIDVERRPGRNAGGGDGGNGNGNGNGGGD